MGMKSMNGATDVLTNPDRFFAELSARDMNMTIPLLIVLIAANITTPGIVAISGLLTLFTLWLLCTGVFYVISIFFGGEGSFKRCLEFVGYGFIPIFVLLWIRSVVIFLTLPPTIDFSSVYTIIGILLLLWSANIWIFGIKHARNLSARNALITVGVPVGIYMVDTTIKMI